MFRSLCPPDIYVHLYYVVNVEADNNVLCLCYRDIYVHLYYVANMKSKKYNVLPFMSTCIT